MRVVASKIHRERRGVLKTISASQDTTPALPREYQTIFKNNGKPMVIVDEDTTISLANAEFARLSGYTKKEIEGTKKWTEFVARQDRRRMKEYHLLRKSDPMLAPRCCEFRFVDRQGKIMNIVLTIGQIPGTTKSMASLQDVTDRRQAEVTQRAGEERYQTFFENSRDAVYITARDGSYVDANRAALDLFGYTREEMKKLKARQLYANPADARRLRKEIEEKGFAQNFEVRLRKKDGTEMDCMFTVTALRGDDGSILEYQGIARDVTAHKRAEEALRKSEEKYRNIFEAMLEGYFEVDLTGNFLFFNDAVAKFFGYPRNELMGLNYQKFTSPEEAQRLFQVFSEVYQTGDPHEIDDYEIIKKDGSIGIAEFSVSLVRTAAGEPIGFRGVTRDVTAKKKMERSLRHSEDSYQKILELAPDGITISRIKDSRYLLVNDAFCQHTGYSAEEGIGRTALELNLFVDHADRERLGKALRQEGRADGLEIQFRAKDGTILHDLVSAKPIRFQGEDCLLVVATNINALKRAQQALRESEERYRTIIENIEDGYYELDLAGHFIFFNDVVCSNLGYSKEELIGTKSSQYQDEAAAKKMYEIYNEIYRTGKPVKALEEEYIRKDGTKMIYELSASLMRDAQGKPIGFRGISRDITRRKKVEEDLRESERKYRTMLDNIGDAYTETDLAGRVTFFNKAISASLGYTEEEFVGMHYKQYTAPESVQKIYDIYSKVYKTGETAKSVELAYIAKNKTRKILESTVALVRDKSGKTIGFKTFTTDITKRRQAEVALRQSEEKYRTILESIEDGYGELDLSGKLTFFNDALPRVLGYPEDEVKKLHFKNRQYIDEENAEKLRQAYTEVYTTGKPNREFQYEIIAQDGTRRYLESSISLKKDAGGQPVGFRGVARDISKRKQMEEALRRSEERYRTILENMQEAYYEIDLAGHLTFFNDALCKHLGYPKEELIGRVYQQYQDETTAKKIYQLYNEVYRTGKPVRAVEAEYIRKDGTKGTYELSVSLLRDAHGKPIGFRGVSRDVTERKQAEEQLRQSEERYRTILETMQEAYYEIDLAGHFTFVNDALCGHLGCSKEELIGADNRQFQDETTAKKMYEIYNEAYRTGEPVKAVEAEYTRKDGTKGTYELSISLIRDAQGEPIGFRGVSRDVTERKKAEEQLKRYAAELERSNEEVKNFAYIVSHDLRVPLVNLKGYTSELRTALGVIGDNFEAVLPHLLDEKRSEVAIALHEDVPEALEFIANSVSRMDSFINAILILSRLGRQDLKPEPLDMNALVQSALESMSHQIKEQGIEVYVGSLPQVAADRTAMERIVGNILSNAVKYVDSEHPCRIEVAAEVNNGETIFTIRDTGRGIAQEDMHKVFAPFRRAGKQDTQGEGMGLSYVQTLVRRHGGRILCESELGKGTTFTFTIATTFRQGASDA